MCKFCETDYSLIESEQLGEILGNRMTRYISMIRNIEGRYIIAVSCSAKDHDYLDTRTTGVGIKYCPFCGREL